MAIPLAEARIPVYEVIGYSGTHQPTLDNPYGDILPSILQRIKLGATPVEAGRHMLVSLPPTLPYHPQGSDVLWVMRKKRNNGHPADVVVADWVSLAQDREFLDEAQRYIGSIHEAGGTTSMHVGYVQPDLAQVDYAYRYGTQTIKIPHAHIIKPFNDIDPDRYLDLDTLKDVVRLVYLSNAAGELANDRLFKHLGSFSSHKFQYDQEYYRPDGVPITYPRTFYGFNTLQEAVQQILILQNELERMWPAYVQKQFYRHPISINQCAQDACINASKLPMSITATITFPNDWDRKEGKVTNLCDVWVALFSITSAVDLLRTFAVNRKRV